MKSSEQLMLQDVWRQAFRQGELVLEFRTVAGAQRARMQLYNSVKGQKAGKDLTDLELTHAAEQLEIVWANDEHTSFRLQKKETSDMMQGIAAALGKKVSDYVDPDALASSEKMLRELEKRKDDPLPGEHQANPFYKTRSGE